MRMRRFILTISLFLVGFAVYGQNADEIIEKSLKAHGAEKFKTVKTWKMVGKTTVHMMNMEMASTYYYKSPNLFRMEIEAFGNKMIQIFDGKDGWMINPADTADKVKPLGEDGVKQMRENFNLLKGPLMDYKTMGKKATYLGKETIDDKTYHKIKLSQGVNQPKTGDEDVEMTVYIDAVSYFMNKVTINVGESEPKQVVTINFKDPKKVKGVVVAQVVETLVDDKKQATIELSDIQADIELDNAMFSKPK